MRRADIISFLSVLGIKGISDTGEWVNAACPMASVSHARGIDRHPSFGILINPYGESVCRCFTCFDPMPLSGLVHNLWVCKIPYWPEAMKIYGEKEIFTTRDSSELIDDIWKDKKGALLKIPVPNRILAHFPALEFSFCQESKQCCDYLCSRGIEKETQNIFSLRYSSNAKAVIFPRVDREKNIWWMSARSYIVKNFFTISPSYMEEPKDAWGDSSVFFGGHLLTKDPVILVESETDVLRLHSLDVHNAIAACGGIRESQLASLFHNVVLFGFDNDVPGFKNKIKAQRYLKGSTTLFSLNWGSVGVKDAAELESKADFDKVYNRKILL